MINTLDIVNKNIDVTDLIQEKIDRLNISEELRFVKGNYHVRNIFLKSNIRLTFEEGTIFNVLASSDNFKIIDTRIAGINMASYGGVINIIDSKNVSLKGHVLIKGNGEYFWEKYWGSDTKGGIRKEYDSKGMRAFADYDLKRPRNLLIQNSNNITIDGLESNNSGFWNIHVLYSYDVVLDNIVVSSYNHFAPSTDGIDIDSSHNVVVKNSTLSTNDDSIAIKSGRDSDGLKTNIPSYDITIENNTILKGFGITLGSEVSGGIYNINIRNNKFFNTDCGFRIKSSTSRKGYIRDINFENNMLDSVSYPIHIVTSWNSSYNNLVLPQNYEGTIYPHYKKLTEVVPNIKNTIIENIKIVNMRAINGKRAFEIIGFEDEHIRNLEIINSSICAREFGRLVAIDNFVLNNVKLNICDFNDESLDSYDNR